MFNLYMYLMAFMYAPSDIQEYLGSNGGSLKEIDQEKERQRIMNEFYETELNDADDSIDMPTARSDTHLNRGDFATRK